MKPCRPWLLWTIVPALGCESPRREGPELTVRDSAGVTVLESRLPPNELRPFAKLDSIPVVRFGVQDGNPDQEFGHIFDAAFVEGNRLLVVDGQTREIRIFTFDGQATQEFGGRGQGPGEFRSISSLGLVRGDSVAVLDRPGRRITVFDIVSGGFSESPLVETEFGLPASVEFFPDGTQLAIYVRVGQPAGDFRTATVLRDSVKLIRLDRSGNVIADFGSFLLGERVRRREGAGATLLTSDVPVPFARQTYWVFSETEVYIGTNETFEIKVFDLSGELRRIIRVPNGTKALGREDIQALKAELLQNAGNIPAARRQVEHRFSDGFFPDQMPAFSDLALDGGQYLWVREYTFLANQATKWWVFDLSGQLEGAVTVPFGTMVHDLSGDLVALQPPHPFDLPMVQVSRLIRTPRSQ